MRCVIVCGSKGFDDSDLLTRELDAFLGGDRSGVVILSGTARGADALGERYAVERGIPVERFPPDWRRFGQGAGLIRNGQMVERADAVLAFWDGASPGTADTIRKAQAAGLPVTVVQFHRKSPVASGPASGEYPTSNVPPGEYPVIAFCNVSAPYGWLGNMSPHPIEADGVVWRTAEALHCASTTTRSARPSLRCMLKWWRPETAPLWWWLPDRPRTWPT